MGHLKDSDLASAMPANAATWVGGLMHNEFVWGKAYVAPGSDREFLRRRGAANAKVATSIFGYADELVWNEAHEAFEIALHEPDETGHTGFVLEYIDFASPERAGVPSLAVVPHITTEMTGDPCGEEPEEHETEDTEGDNPMDKLEIIQAMTADDVKLLPESVVQAVVNASEPVQELAGARRIITELRQVLGLGDADDLVGAVKDMATQVQQANAAAVEARLAELVNDPETGVKAPVVRALVLELLRAEKPGTVEEADAAYADIRARDSVKAALQAELVSTMGSAQRRPVTPAADGTDTGKFVEIPEKEDE
jgi:hypothetical protein